MGWTSSSGAPVLLGCGILDVDRIAFATQGGQILESTAVPLIDFIVDVEPQSYLCDPCGSVYVEEVDRRDRDRPVQTPVDPDPRSHALPDDPALDVPADHHAALAVDAEDSADPEPGGHGLAGVVREYPHQPEAGQRLAGPGAAPRTSVQYAMLALILAGCITGSTMDTGDAYVDDAEVAGPPGFWALVHPSQPDARGPGIYFVDTTVGSASGPLPAPDGLISPHALFDDGDGLLVGGYVDSAPGDCVCDLESVFRVNYDGIELASFLQPGTEGITGNDGIIYVSEGWGSPIDVRTSDWELVSTIEVDGFAQDIAVDGHTLYVLDNDAGGDLIRAFDLDTPSTPARLITEQATFSNGGYAMMFWDNHLVVGDKDAGGNFLRHLNPATGESLGITRFGVQGWITAIALPG